MREIAENHFHGIENLNCAQSVLKTFQTEYDLCDTTIAEHKKSRGGRVEGNLCGALHAAQILANSEEMKQQIERDFITEVGSSKCREIRSQKQISCRSCTGLAAEILHKHRPKTI